jgi:Fur family ferric uptake transcriptional regulator
MSNLNNTEIHTAVHDLLHNAGQRYTDKRRVIIDILIQSGKPMLITDILQRAKNMPQSTLYRNLLVLETSKAVVRVVTNAESGCYELAEHLMGHHHHMVCAECGSVSDVVVPEHLEHELEKALAKVARSEGFSIDRHQLDLIGRCKNCA